MAAKKTRKIVLRKVRPLPIYNTNGKKCYVKGYYDKTVMRRIDSKVRSERHILFSHNFVKFRSFGVSVTCFGEKTDVIP